MAQEGTTKEIKMVIQTENSTYILTGVGRTFEVRKVSRNGGFVSEGEIIKGDDFILRPSEPFRLFLNGKSALTTSLVQSFLG